MIPNQWTIATKNYNIGIDFLVWVHTKETVEILILYVYIKLIITFNNARLDQLQCITIFKIKF